MVRRPPCTRPPIPPVPRRAMPATARRLPPAGPRGPCGSRPRAGPCLGRDALRRFVLVRPAFGSAADRCARPGSHVGQKLNPRYL